MELTLSLNGYGEALDKADTAERLDMVLPAAYQTVYLWQNRMADYPPPPAQSKYRRTGTLGRRWTTDVRRQPNQIKATIGNNTEYAPFVQSDQWQASVHEGRWQTDQDVVDQELSRVLRFFEQAIQDALR